jgi:hypothetical protein
MLHVPLDGGLPDQNCHNNFHFLTAEEQALAEIRILDDRGDVKAEEFSMKKCLIHFADPKLHGFCVLVCSGGEVHFLF